MIFLSQPRVNRLRRDTRSYVCPGLSLDLIKPSQGGFLHKKVTLAYLVSLGELLSALS